MNTNTIYLQDYLWLLGVVAIWDLVWKGLGLWRAARYHQRNWFVAILILNTIGILPIIYILFYQRPIHHGSP